jgi:uncharacterized RDD family membrane protein YckC
MAAMPTDEPLETTDDEPLEATEEDAPEGPPPPVHADLLADPGQRLLARIVDTLVVGLPVVMVIREVVHGHAAEVIAPPIVAGALFLYEWPQLALWGRTLGKRFAGVQVVRESLTAALAPDAVGAVPGGPTERSERPETERPDGRIGVFRALLRAGVYAAPIAVRPVPILGIIGGLLWVVNAGALFEGDRRQAGHDRLAGTVVVKRPDRSGS